MTEPSPAVIARAFLTAMEPLDYATALAFIAPGCDYRNVPLGTVYGPDGVRAVLEPFFAPTLENEFKVLREVVQGNVVVVERRDRHRLASGWVELPVVGIFEVNDGLITLWHEYFDAATLMQHWPSA